MGLLDKVKDLLSKNADKVDTAIDKASDVADRKYKGTVDKVELLSGSSGRPTVEPARRPHSALQEISDFWPIHERDGLTASS
jgi:MT0933-like antitoxin protein